MGLFTHGNVDNTQEDFIGVDQNSLKTYIEKVVLTAIEDTINAIKDDATLFDAFDTGWSGQSVINYKRNFRMAESALTSSLTAAYAALVQEIVAVVNGLVEQDQNMVKVYEGSN